MSDFGTVWRHLSFGVGAGVHVLSWMTLASVRFRYLVVVLAAGLMFLAVSKLSDLSVNVLPETRPVVVEVQIEALGLSAPEVESLVTVPIEKNLLEGVLGVTDVTSDSIPGLAAIDLHFAAGTNLYQARQLVQERLNSAFILPNVSKPPVMLQPVSSSADVMVIGLTSKTLSQVKLSVLSRWTLVPRLLGVAGVANVSTFGQADLQLQVQVDPSVLAAHHLAVDDVVNAVGNSQLVTPLSYLQGSTPGADGFLENSNQRITIRHVLPFGTPANLAQIPVVTQSLGPLPPGTKSAGKPPILGSVATVVDGHQPLIGDAMNSTNSNGLLLVVQKLPNASAVSVTRGLDAALVQMGPALTGVHVNTTVFRPGTYLSLAGHNDRVAVIVAAALALLALLLLLLSLRFALVCVVAIAVSVIVATSVLQGLGYTFSSIVLLGLLLALAVVVQDAVGSTAAVMAAFAKPDDEEPVPPVINRVAIAYREFGRTFVGGSVVALICVAPLFVATGLTATFLRPMVLAFGFAIFASMLVALIISPALAAIVLSVGTKREPRGLVIVRWLGAVYSRILRQALAAGVWGLATACILGAVGLAITLPMLHPSQPVYQDRNLDVTWTGEPGMSLLELNRITARADSELVAIPGVQQVSATLGRAVTSDQIDNTNTGHIWVQLKPTADYAKTVAAVRGVVGGTPGMLGTVSTYETDSMAGVLSKAPTDADVRVYGPSYPEVLRIAANIRTMMSSVPGLGEPHVQAEPVQPTINIEVKADAAKVYGLTPGDVRREAGTLLLGLTVGNFFESDKVFDVVVEAQRNLVSNLTEIRNVQIDDGSGGEVKLGTVATVTSSSEPEDIKHDQFTPYVDITALVKHGDSGSVDAAISRGLSQLGFPLEYHAQLQAPPPRGTSRTQFVSYLLAALLGVALIVQAALGSWRLVLLTIAAVLPAVAVASAVALGIGSTSLSAAAGVLAVVVISLRQSIAVAGRIRRRHVTDGGELTDELLVAASSEGVGWVIFSALLTILVLGPFVVMGETAGTETVHAAAVVIVCGLVVASLVNLLLLPTAVLKAGPTAPVPRETEDQATGDLAWVAASRSPAV
jgi:multidrug efflux pump subunit AcrB